MATVFDPASKGVDFTLSNVNKTATKNADNDQGVRCAYPITGSQKIYMECEQVLGGGFGGWGDYSGFGIQNAAAPLTHPGNTSDGIGIYGSGIIVRNELVEITTTPVASAGNGRYRLAIDKGAQLGWLATDGNNWNNNPSANPATGVGGISLASLGSGPWWPAIGAYGSTSVMTLKTAAAEWLYAAPSGFSEIGAGPAWTPANLATRPIAEFNSDNVTWSGSSFSSCPNTGTAGGSWGIGTTALPTKAASAVNGHYPAKFTRASSQGLRTSVSALVPAGPKQVFAVVVGLADTHGALIQQNWGVNFGDVWYVRDGGKMVAYNGTPAGLCEYRGTADPGTALRHMTVRFAATGDPLPQQMRLNGVDDLSFVSDPTRAPVNNTDDFWLGESGNHFGGEFLEGQVLYAMHGVGLPDGEVQKLEGWASWTYAGDGSLLPAGHPYKAAAPTTGSTGSTYSNAAAIAAVGSLASSGKLSAPGSASVAVVGGLTAAGKLATKGTALVATTLGLVNAGRLTMAAASAIGATATSSAAGGSLFSGAIGVATAGGLSPGAALQVVGALSVAAGMAQASSGKLTSSSALALAIASGFTAAGKLTASPSIGVPVAGGLAGSAGISAQLVASIAVALAAAAAGAVTPGGGGPQTYNETLTLAASALLSAAGVGSLNVSASLAVAVGQAVSAALAIASSATIAATATAAAGGRLVVTGSVGIPASAAAAAGVRSDYGAQISFTAQFNAQAAARLSATAAAQLAAHAALGAFLGAIDPITRTVELEGSRILTVNLTGIRDGDRTLSGTMQVVVDLVGALRN